MHPIHHAATRPDHAAIVNATSGRTITYGELDAFANRAARWLRARGAARGTSVGLLLENRPLYLEMVWATQRMGAMLVPIATRLTAPEIAYILADAECTLLLTSRAFADVTGELARIAPGLTIIDVDSDAFTGEIAEQSAEMIEDPVPGQYMLYSSGTTGRPKGIVPPPPPSEDITTPNALVGLATMGVGMPSDGSMVYLSPAPLYHAAPLGWCTTVHRLGGTVVIMEKFTPEGALAAIEKYRVTDSQWVPTHFVRMLKLPEEERTKYDLSSHQRAIHAAAPCPVPIKQAMIEWWGPIIQEYYAGSEGIGMSLVKSEEWLARPGTVGRMIYGKAHVCAEDGSELPPGETGLLFFENETLPSYHKDPGKTADAMHERGWMTLGDIGHVDEDGFIFLTDRKSHMIISGGVNIYPQEIENLLVAHDKVLDAAVIGAPDPDLGERVVAVIQPVDFDTAGEALEEELRAFLEPQLSRVKMPRRFDFRPELPREANGKLYKRELREEYAKQAELTG
ncbi:acyl-CoA synthetase [Alteriqipengyuania lutimaris]|uniref:Acyl-CoA synthetase n=1 Tax=Alteriqipengyuania lutimaris TaxID=1538146 RepID=A0A395LIT8_9SPHN|nr:acyl-CoA synthetase [Alteriqipengyuania lutimaris]MBB3034206.1 fatty-acyl-CoA synthase [Alteriqipengyuania lutimaris]RDS76873.1 acyl-CoA synthetase [Alteriqipengyuania lutimaris]